MHHASVTSPQDDQTAELTGAIDRLAHEYAGVHSRETVEQCVHDSAARLGPARVQTYQGLFAYRFARQRLRDAAVVAGRLPGHVPTVLFVCTKNAARSQFAAALLEHAAQGRVEVRSAGTTPDNDVDPAVREVMASSGLPADTAFPKPLTDEAVAAADVVVTMGCGDACPVLPGGRYLDWDLPDPEGCTVEVVQAVRVEIAKHVQHLLADLGAPAPGARMAAPA